MGVAQEALELARGGAQTGEFVFRVSDVQEDSAQSQEACPNPASPSAGEKPLEVLLLTYAECCFCTRIVIQSPRRCPWIAQMARLKPSTPHLHRR